VLNRVPGFVESIGLRDVSFVRSGQPNLVCRDRVRKTRPAIIASPGESGGTTRTIRDAPRIPQDRRLAPENVQHACEYGLGEILTKPTS
jgi:hypothetical protein